MMRRSSYYLMNEKSLPSRSMNSTEGKNEVVMKQKRGGLHHKEDSTYTACFPILFLGHMDDGGVLATPLNSMAAPAVVNSS